MTKCARVWPDAGVYSSLLSPIRSVSAMNTQQRSNSTATNSIRCQSEWPVFTAVQRIVRWCTGFNQNFIVRPALIHSFILSIGLWDTTVSCTTYPRKHTLLDTKQRASELMPLRRCQLSANLVPYTFTPNGCAVAVYCKVPSQQTPSAK